MMTNGNGGAPVTIKGADQSYRAKKQYSDGKACGVKGGNGPGSTALSKEPVERVTPELGKRG